MKFDTIKLPRRRSRVNVIGAFILVFAVMSIPQLAVCLWLAARAFIDEGYRGLVWNWNNARGMWAQADNLRWTTIRF